MPRPRKEPVPCSFEWCDRPARSKGMCGTCYGREWSRATAHASTEVRERRRAANRTWAANRKPNPVTVTEKRCGTCTAVKPAVDFHRQLLAPDGLQAVCKGCSKASQDAYALTRRCKKVGITVDQYEALRERQGGMCGVCKRRPATDLDHCHATGKFRGLVCAACNRILGTVQDDATLLRRLAAYVDTCGLPV